ARGEAGQQGEGGRDLVPAGEVVLNQERAVVAKRFRFDVEIDEVMKALAHRRAGTRAASLRRTKNSKSHDQNPYSRRAPVLARQRWRLGFHVGIERGKGYPASLHHADLKMSLRRVGCQLHRWLVVMRWASVVMVAVAAHVVIVIVRRPRLSLCGRYASDARFCSQSSYWRAAGCTGSQGLRRYAASALTARAVRRAHRIPPGRSPGPRGVRARESEMPAPMECGCRRRRAAVASP